MSKERLQARNNLTDVIPNARAARVRNLLSVGRQKNTPRFSATQPYTTFTSHPVEPALSKRKGPA